MVQVQSVLLTVEEKVSSDSGEERTRTVSVEEDSVNVDNYAPRVQKTNSEDTPVFDNRTHACPENEHERVQNLNPNMNNINKTNMSKTILSIIIRMRLVFMLI